MDDVPCHLVLPEGGGARLEMIMISVVSRQICVNPHLDVATSVYADLVLLHLEVLGVVVQLVVAL